MNTTAEEDKENDVAEPSNETAHKANNNDGSEKTNEEERQPLYYSKDGKTQFGLTVPSAFALSCPFPPLPTNLAKNRVLRPQSEQSKEKVQESIIEAEKSFEKEAMPLPGLSKVEGSPLKKMLIPEIELALYWDRHAYEFRPKVMGGKIEDNKNGDSRSGKQKSSGSSSSVRRSKSEMNLSSQVGEILNEENKSNSRRSSLSSAGKSSRASISNISAASSNKRNSHHQLVHSLPPASRNNNHNFKDNPEEKLSDACNISNDGDKVSNNGGSISGKAGHQLPMQHLNESEKKKFDDIKISRQSNSPREKNHSVDTRPKLIRSAEQARQMEAAVRKSTGIQVTLDDVAAAALKSTYLCPLHGQYRRGIERRDKGGFRTDMSSVANVHKNCSRALKGIPSKTKLIKSSETQTDDELPMGQSTADVNVKTKQRSKTAVHARNLNSRLKDIMFSEYHGSFRNPYKIAESEKRHLRNKILNYCFTKHSIF